MEQIRITGVPEHFNFPWQLLVKEQPFLKDGVNLVWEDESRGSGAMNSAIRNDSTDLAIILTESFLKDKIDGNPGKIIGYHVKSPLVWGIHVPAEAGVNNLNDLKSSPFLVSRKGSGSHLMSFLLAKREGWNPQDLNFEIINNLDGAISSFKDNKVKAFLWEKFTTKPLVDQGLFKRVGEIPTPWPCFVIVASDKILEHKPELLQKILNEIYSINREILEDKESFVLPISKAYSLEAEDVRDWIRQTTWAEDAEVPSQEIGITLETLMGLGLIDEKMDIAEFIQNLNP
ncbi:substrate-binding domain-containing protein [Cyclobacterium marinum]|uniref:Periplasmic substrate-binding protein n=1 Tax=Cyclobacterium marinum (strain ATCC 25205 / DSM 745 / LMG 13164 / NCIMB 1802) TaxID=880070 RepID=G0J8E7_CYCMS|nr:substrate-binding domain-containing protein [Cyclobacterium marinum]AEL28747.1 periplasmic substrate-binding protein [Cyclobacterium marinum DSM 745]